MNKENKPIVGWMTTPDFSMMTNEAPHGGFKWEFLDFKPTRFEHMDFNRPIFVYTKRQPTPDQVIERVIRFLKDQDLGTLNDFNTKYPISGYDYAQLVKKNKSKILKREGETE